MKRLNKIISLWAILLTLSISLVFAEDISAIDNDRSSLPDIKVLSDFRKEKGLRNLEPQSIALISRGLKALQDGKEEEAIAFFKGAARLSPDLPQSYIYLAKASFSFTSEGLTETVGYLRDAWRALLNNFWWSFRTAGNFLIALYLSIYISIIVLVIFLIIPRFSLYIHDIHEDKKRFLLLIPSIIFVLFGPIFGILAFILPFWLYLKKKEKVLLYILFLIVAVIIPLVPFLSSFLNASSNVTLRNIININSGLYTGDTVYLLRGRDDYETTFTYALDLKRKGRYEKAIEIYKSLIGKYGKVADAKLYNNIANCYVGLNDNETALSYYTKSLQTSELASTYYNLSQMYREFFNFKEGEEYYGKALSISPEKVRLFIGLRGTTVNSFVVDEILSIGELWSLAFKTTSSDTSSGHLGKILSFTNKWVSYFLLLLTVIAISIYDRMAPAFAYRCVRCGSIQCSHCEKKLARDEMCHLCYSALTDITRLSVRERISRIVQIHRYREDRIQRLKAMTLLLPGSGHIFYGWTTQGFFIMFLFIFFLISAFMWTYFIPSVSMTDAAALFRWISVTGLIIIYVVTTLNVFKKVPRRWH